MTDNPGSAVSRLQADMGELVAIVEKLVKIIEKDRPNDFHISVLQLNLDGLKARIQTRKQPAPGPVESAAK